MAEKIGTWGDRLAVRMVGHFPRRTIDLTPDRPIVSFTFDDAPQSAADNGARLVEQAGGRATFYLSGRLMRDGSPDDVMIDERQARELAARGHEIGCHSFAHRKLGGFARGELQADLRANDAVLRRADGREDPRNFAVPFTMATPGTQAELRSRYLTSRGGWPGVNRAATDPHFLKAVELREERLTQPHVTDTLNAIKDVPGWLIFFAHDISDQPGMFGCSTSGFARLVEMVADTGCQMLTVDGALEAMGVRTELKRRMGRLGDTPQIRHDDSLTATARSA